MKIRKTITIIYLFLLFFAAAETSRAQCVPASAAGAFDNCFDGDGKVTTDITEGSDWAEAVVVQPDGKIVAAGVAGANADGAADFALVRYNADGSLDTTFDGDGIVVTDFGFGTNDRDHIRSIALQSDGKIVVAGDAQIDSATFGFAVARYNANGSLDTTFSDDGKANFMYGSNYTMEGHDVVVQPDGKIIIAGNYINPFSTYSLIVRFNPNGSLDGSFNNQGYINATLSGAYAIALEGDKILVAGTDRGYGFMGLARFHSNGSRDTSFGDVGFGNGIKTYRSFDFDSAFTMRVRFDGRIFAGGTSAALHYGIHGVLVHFPSDRRVGEGMVHPDDYSFLALTFQSDGKILTAGKRLNPAWDFTIRRFIDTNVPDPTFAANNGGAVNVKFLSASTPEAASVYDITTQRDNKIVAVGSMTEITELPTPSKFAITRIMSGLRAPHAEQFDFDGDSKADVSIFRPSNGEWWYLKSSNGGNAAAQFGAGTDTPAPGDYTGDGKTDIAFWRASTGEWFVLRSEDYSYYSFSFGTSGDIPRPSDFDGDGKTDYIVYRPSQNYWYRMNSLGITLNGQLGIAGDKPVIADFDGDGKSDKAVYRPSTGHWWWQSSINNALHYAEWGISTDIPVAADYDGDLRTDVAVYRPSNGTWYIYNSATNSLSIRNFGLADDKPVAADYDGDGKADIAVFRPSTGTWYLQQTTSGFAAAQFGLSADMPVPNAFVP